MNPHSIVASMSRNSMLKWLSVPLWTKWLWIQVQLQSLNTGCSSINWPSNLINNVFTSVHHLGFNSMLLLFSPQNFTSFPDFLSKVEKHCWGDFFTNWWKAEEEWFWRFENFSKLKIAFVNTEIQLKSKLAWSVFQKSMKLK